MSRPPHARESVLDAFEAILVDDGERAATMDATARAAGVSKGGLLYHFGSKEALEAGIIERLRRARRRTTSPPWRPRRDGPIAYFLRSSVMQNDPLDRAIIAASRLAQGGSAPASAALRDIRDRWADALRPHTKDAAALDLVMLVSDGLYFNNALAGRRDPGPVPRGADLDALIAHGAAGAAEAERMHSAREVWRRCCGAAAVAEPGADEARRHVRSPARSAQSPVVARRQRDAASPPRRAEGEHAVGVRRGAAGRARS